MPTVSGTRLAVLLLHGVVLAAASLAAIVAGFAAWSLVRGVDQLLVQLPVAVVLTLAAFPAWLLAARHLLGTQSPPRSTRELALVLVVALLAGPLLLVPLHYVTQGYLTSPGNLLALLAFQGPVDLAAVALAPTLVRGGTARS